MRKTNNTKEKLNVLVALIPDTKDWVLVQNQLWYRVPQSNAPSIVKNGSAEYIAFYHPASFPDELKWKIVKYARISRITVATRHELFPDEPKNSRKSHKSYFKIQLEELRDLPQPIESRSGRRILFISTSEEKFFSGTKDINRIFKSSPLENQMEELINAMAIVYEREWIEYVDEKRFYILDFAIFCKNGNIDIECDGDEYHMGDNNVHYDKTRNNELESYKWSVLRYTTKHFNEQEAHIKKTLYKTIEQYGGVTKATEPEIAYYPKVNPKGQYNLFNE
jgi:REase_MTES_1575